MRKNKTWVITLTDNSRLVANEPIENAVVYTTDTEAYLNFRVIDSGFDFDSATIAMLNKDDGSIVERPMTKEVETAVYEIEADIIPHFGLWQAQVLFKQGEEIFTSTPVKFVIERYMGAEQPPRLEDVVSWQRLYDNATETINELIRVNDELINTNETVQQAEAQRVLAENERSEKYESYAQQFDDVMAELSEEKDYASLPEIAAARGGHESLGSRLDDTTAQLAQTSKEINDLRTRNKYVKNTDRAINNIIEIGLTYYDREDFEYGNNQTMVSTNTSNAGAKLNGKYQIDCSSFMHALLMDIPYEKSAYANNGVNYPNSNGFKFDIERDKYPYNTVKPELVNTRMLANDIAYFAHVNGWQHYIKDNDFSTIEVGDFIFYHSNYGEGFYDDIGHIAVVIDIQEDNENVRSFTILESAPYATNGVSITVGSEPTLIQGKIKSFGRFPLSDKGGLPSSINLVKNENAHQLQQDEFVSVNVNRKLEYYKPYTIYFEVDDLITNSYPRIAVYDSKNNYRGTVFSFVQKKYAIGGDKTYYATFFIDKRFKDLSNSVIQIGLFNTQEQIFSYKVSNVILYSNYVNVSNLHNNYKEVDYYEKDNGTSVKLDDGTLIQTHRMFSHEYNIREEANGVYRATNEWVFPVEFKKPPVVTVSTTGAGVWADLTQTPNNTKCVFNVLSNVETSVTLNTFLIAIGRWK